LETIAHPRILDKAGKVAQAILGAVGDCTVFHNLSDFVKNSTMSLLPVSVWMGYTCGHSVV
jgi:hypothetical protein